MRNGCKSIEWQRDHAGGHWCLLYPGYCQTSGLHHNPNDVVDSDIMRPYQVNVNDVKF